MSNQCRLKQTARLGTGGVTARQAQQWRMLTTVQASSSDPPIIDTRQSPAVESMLAQFAEDDLNRDALWRFEEIVRPTLSGRVSRQRRDDLIAECKAQIVAERAAADAANSLLNLDPVAPVEDQAEPEAESEAEPEAETETQPEAQAAPPAPVTGNKRNRRHLKFKGTILHNAAKGEHKPEYWTVNYKRTRNTFYTQASAEAALKGYQDLGICPCCDRPDQLKCEQCGHTHGDPIQPPPPSDIRCVALHTGVIQVTVNGVTFRVNGDFNYP